MTTATLRISTPAAARVAAKPAAPRKGFWTRFFETLVEARQREIQHLLARHTSKDGKTVYLTYI